MIYRAERNPDNDAWRVVYRTRDAFIVAHDNLNELKATGLAYSMNQQYSKLLEITKTKL